MMKSFRFKNNKFLALIFIVISSSSIAQTIEDLNAFKMKYPGQHFVCKKDVTKITIRVEKGVPVVKQQFISDLLVLDKSGAMNVSEGSIRFSSFEKVLELEAYAIVPNGKGSKKIPASNFQTKDVQSQGFIFHDDTKETGFMYTGLTEGSVRVIDYTIQMSEVTFPFQHRFSNRIPVEESQLIIDCDTSVHLLLREFYLDKSGMTKNEVLEKGKRISTWTIKNPVELKNEDFETPVNYYAPHIIGQIAYQNTKKGRKQYTETLQDLHNLYKDNVKEVENEVPSGELKAIADSITKGLTTDFEKVRSVYYWVQNQIKYIAFEEGKEGFIPRQPSRVITKRYGDCKDMASLIYSMLKAVDVKTYLTWIGSRDLPYSYSELPSSACDNHMIAVYKEKEKYYFLDATNPLQSIYKPTSFIQGKEGLVHLSPDQFEVVKVPIAKAEDDFMYDTTRIQLDNLKVKGSSKVILGGYYGTIVGNTIKDVNPKDLNDALKNLNEKGNNSFFLKNGKCSDVSNREQPIQMDFDFTIDNYVTQYEKEIYVNMILNKQITRINEFKSERIAPYENDFPFSDNYTVELAIPEGYTIKSIPQNSEYKDENVHYSVRYTKRGNTIVMDLNLKLNFLVLRPEQFKGWNEFQKIKKSSLKESVVLMKK